MRVVCDIEANALEHPTQIWVVVAFDIDTKEYHIFRNITSDLIEREKFLEFSKSVELWIGHNWLGYDFPVLHSLLGLDVPDISTCCLDTLIVSKLVDYPRDRHSLEDYGEEFSYPKIKHNDFSKYSLDLEDYCKRDVDITYKVYLKYLKYTNDILRIPSIRLEHLFQYHVVNSLSTNGFSFDSKEANRLLTKVTLELDILDKEILKEFPSKTKLIREVLPKATKYGTISLTSIPKVLRDQIPYMTVGEPFSLFGWEEFNPASHKQIIDVLNKAGWSPTDKTKTHIDTERELNRLKYQKHRSTEVDLRIKECYDTLSRLEKTGWKINENNLATLPLDAPSPARTLAKRILLEARRRTLTEWLGLVQTDGRIHGKYYGIGAWTHRMAHQAPNTANIPNEYDTAGQVKLLGKEMRQLWRAPTNRLLVGVDAEGIQLRIFAHYIDDPEFTKALVEGRKDDKTDPHSLNQRILGSVCKSRAAAKRFIYALLLGAGLSKLSEILGCSDGETREALDRLLRRYTGFAFLKEKVMPADARRGWFTGLDGRAVRIPGETQGARKHLAMSGYLQNGEVVIMKRATMKWLPLVREIEGTALLVNLVHDEWQTETGSDQEKALRVAQAQSESLKAVGEELQLKCPLAGSYWNDDHKHNTIGNNWYQTH